MNPLEQMLLTLKEMGFDLILVWALSIAIVYGILTKLKLPESYSARGVISIAAGFLIMLASAGSAIPTIIQNIVVSLVVVGFLLLMVVIFLELLGVKSTELLEKHSGIALVVIAGIVAAIFVASGASSLFNFPLVISQGTLTFVIFLIFAAMIVWVLAKEGEGGGD